VAGRPTIPTDHDITATSTIAVVKIPQANAVYYKDLWLHRIQSSHGLGSDFAVIVDGYVAAIGNLSMNPISSPKRLDADTVDSALMVYAVGAPHDSLRLTRLSTMLCLQKPTIDIVYGPSSYHASLARDVITVEYTRHPEAKGLRGLMKLDRKEKHPDGFKLVYRQPLGAMDPVETLVEWVRLEARWRKNSTKGKP
jgi:hypothetical protein